MLLVISACGALPFARGADAAFAPSPSHGDSISSSSTAADAGQPSTYTVEKGDTLASVAHQFHCTTSSLRKLNGLRHSRLKPGLVLDIPHSHRKRTAGTRTTRKKHEKSSSVASNKSSKRHHHTPSAQPVQDFDVAPSTFASCPVPVPGDSDESAPATDIPNDARIASVEPNGETSTSLPAQLMVKNHHDSLLPVPSGLSSTSTDESVPKTFSAHQNAGSNATARQAPATVLSPSDQHKSGFASAIARFFGGSHTSESGEWGNKFLTEAKNLASHGVGYDCSWRPEGEAHSWAMDCSNTTRYLYRVTAGIQLPRTASDQYYYLHLQDKAWNVPMTSRGFADCNFLRSNLKPGDLLFWENTYRPERQPPITHVMIFLGTDSRGRWLMAGSQSGHHGFYNPHRNGPDVYVFDPTQYSGGYTTWMGLVHHHGRFVAYGRPLEADVKKLTIAAND